jgi:inner membrane protein
VILDLMTIYGTQIFWPFDTTPMAIPVLFIIDPLFTFPILSGVLAVLVFKRHFSLGHQLNTIGLFLSLAYLGWAIFAGEYVERRVTEKLSRQQVSYSQIISSPAPFNTLLWRIVGIQKDRYFETYFSLFDGNRPLFVNFYPRNLALMTGIEEHPPVVKLKWFTKGYYSFSTVDKYVAMTDLRMGSEPNYVFRFKVARLNNLHSYPIDDERLKSNLDWRHLAWVWKRIWKAMPPNLENVRSLHA